MSLRKEEAIGVTGEAIQKERHIANEVIKALPPAEHDKYAAMVMANEELLQVKTSMAHLLHKQRGGDVGVDVISH